MAGRVFFSVGGPRGVVPGRKNLADSARMETEGAKPRAG